jgi:hypothetical protein
MIMMMRTKGERKGKAWFEVECVWRFGVDVKIAWDEGVVWFDSRLVCGMCIMLSRHAWDDSIRFDSIVVERCIYLHEENKKRQNSKKLK